MKYLENNQLGEQFIKTKDINSKKKTFNEMGQSWTKNWKRVT